MTNRTFATPAPFCIAVALASQGWDLEEATKRGFDIIAEWSGKLVTEENTLAILQEVFPR